MIRLCTAEILPRLRAEAEATLEAGGKEGGEAVGVESSTNRSHTEIEISRESNL
jgi:hypothetical protein